MNKFDTLYENIISESINFDKLTSEKQLEQFVKDYYNDKYSKMNYKKLVKGVNQLLGWAEAEYMDIAKELLKISQELQAIK